MDIKTLINKGIDMHMNKQFKKKLLASVMVGILGLTVAGCDDDDKVSSTISVGEVGVVTISGMAIDAVTRNPISNLLVTLSVNGHSYKVRTDVNGAYSFTEVTSDTDYKILVEDDTNSSDESYVHYVVESVKGDTPSRTAGISNEVLTVKIDDIELYKSVVTNITAKDITTGSVVEGLSFYYEDDAERSIIAEENTAGVYSFALPNNGEEQTVKFELLIDSNGAVYELYSNTDADNAGGITAGKDITLFVKSFDSTEFTVYVHVVDDDGHPMDAGPTLLVGGEYLPRKADSTNEYVLKVDADTMFNTRLVSPLDIDGDGFSDYIAKYSLNADDEGNLEGALGVINQLNRGSFDENHEVTIVVPMTEVSYDESLQAEIISSDENFQQGGIAEIIVAFDRPVSLIHQPRMTHKELTTDDVMRQVETVASLYDEELETIVTTDNNGNSLTLNGENEYDYIDKDGAAQKLSIADDNGEVVTPYEDAYDYTLNVTDISATEFLAGNTILKLTLDSSTILADQDYTFEFAVEGMQDQNTRATLNLTKTAKSSATSTLEEIWLDNFDGKQTPTKDPSDIAAELDNVGQTEFTSRFTTINDTYGGEKLAQLEYLTYGISGMQIAELESGFYDQNSLYLVSKAQIEGTIQLISQTEQVFEDGEVITESNEILQGYYRFSNDKTDNVNDNGDLSGFSDNVIIEHKVYLLNVPANYGIKDSGISDVYNVPAVTGANSDSSGVYYLYQLPVTPMTAGHISSVNVNVNLSINGAAVVGSKELIVQ